MTLEYWIALILGIALVAWIVHDLSKDKDW